MTVRETWILFLYRLATVSSIADDAEDTLQNIGLYLETLNMYRSLTWKSDRNHTTTSETNLELTRLIEKTVDLNDRFFSSQFV